MPVYKYGKIMAEKPAENFERRVTFLDNLMVVVCDFKNGPAVEPDPPHTHPHEQITYVASGELVLYIGDEKHHLQEGDIFTVPSGLAHCIQILSRHVRLIDSFTPVRQDFIKKRGG
jgi:quercetin dioxygenase-like cupin family protein